MDMFGSGYGSPVFSMPKQVSGLKRETLRANRSGADGRACECTV